MITVILEQFKNYIIVGLIAILSFSLVMNKWQSYDIEALENDLLVEKALKNKEILEAVTKARKEILDEILDSNDTLQPNADYEWMY